MERLKWGLFGPIMTIWFITLAVLGVINIVQAPQILTAFSPHHAISFVIFNPGHAFMVLGAVFLVMTVVKRCMRISGILGSSPFDLAGLVL